MAAYCINCDHAEHEHKPGDACRSEGCDCAFSGKPTAIYVASKSIHASKWRVLRSVGVPIISTWIDHGEDADMTALWCSCIDEARNATHVIAYYESDETWKGAFVEIGAALASGAQVWVIGDPPGSWVNHPLVGRAHDIYMALGIILNIN